MATAPSIFGKDSKAPDFPGIKSVLPDCYQEIVNLAVQHPDLKKLLEQWDVTEKKDDLFGSALRQSLWQAAEDCKWDIADLRKKFPMLCQSGGVVGMADSGSYVPKLVYTLNGGQWFEMVCDERSQDGEEMAFDKESYMNGGEYHEWKLEDIEGRSYLVLSRWDREHAGDTSQERKIIYVLINGTQFMRMRTEYVDVPMK